MVCSGRDCAIGRLGLVTVGSGNFVCVGQGSKKWLRRKEGVAMVVGE